MLYGRGVECELIEDMLSAANRGEAHVSVLHGAAGVGKTALLRYAQEVAADMKILSAVGVEAESHLPFAGLHMLLRSVGDSISRIPVVQGEALRAALGAVAGGQATSRFLIGAALVSLLAEVAEHEPVLCLVDDAQWLDRDSLDALMFASRRLEQDRVCVLITYRNSVGEDTPPPDLTRGVRLMPVGPLDPNAVECLLDHLTVSLDRRARDAVANAAEGNPLAVMELSGENLLGAGPPGDELTVVNRIQKAYARRAAGLSQDAQEFLCLASADDTGDLLVLRAVARSWGLDPEVVDEAAGAGLVRVLSSGLEFTHPLVRSGIYRSSTERLRQRSHLALSEAIRDPDGALSHRASATLPPDDELAQQLAQMAERAQARGARVQAAKAFSRAAAFTTRPEARGRWLVDGAEAAWTGGDIRLTRHMLADELLRAPDGVDGARVGWLSGRVEAQTGDVIQGYELLVEAAERYADSNPALAASMLADALRSASFGGDVARVVHAGTLGAALLDRSGPLPEASHVAGVAAMLQQDFVNGARLLSETIAGLRTSDDPEHLVRAATAAAYLSQTEAVRSLASAAVMRCRATAAVGTLTAALEILAMIEFDSSPQRAAEYALEGLELAKDSEQIPHQAVHLSTLATIDALRGDRVPAEEHAKAVADLAQQHGLMFAHARGLAALGLLELGLGRPEQALVHLDRLVNENVHPAVALSVLADFIEAASRSGEEGKARAGLQRLEAYGHATGGRAGIAGMVHRSRALLTAAPDEAERLLTKAVAELTDTGSSFETARTRLFLGEHLRRNRRRAQARPHLRAAIEVFQELQANPWLARARTELRATGETVSRSDRSGIRLTPQERQISALVAAGASSKEVAAQLFISPRTVDYHLRKVFAKLGISSRRELLRFDLGEGHHEDVSRNR